MGKIKPLKTENLRTQALQVVLQEIAHMESEDNRLMSEEELSQRLQISRTTVREVLQSLAADGHLTRRHGKGNFAHPSTLQLSHRIDLSADFFKLLNSENGVVTQNLLHSENTTCCPAMQKYFPGTCARVYHSVETYNQNGVAKIVCKTSVPIELIRVAPTPGEVSHILTDWMERHCGIDGAYYAAKVDCTADVEANRALGLYDTQVIQNWHEVLYDIQDRPVAFCDIFFHPEEVNLSMVLRF